MRRTAITTAALLSLATLLVAACGGDDVESGPAVTTTTAAEAGATSTTDPTGDELVDPDPGGSETTQPASTSPAEVPEPLEGWEVTNTSEVTSMDLVAPCEYDAFEADSIAGTMTEYESPDGEHGVQVGLATGDPDEVAMVAATWDDYLDCADLSEIDVARWDVPADDTIGYTATMGDGADAITQWLALWSDGDRIVVVNGTGADTEDLVAEVSAALR